MEIHGETVLAGRDPPMVVDVVEHPACGIPALVKIGREAALLGARDLGRDVQRRSGFEIVAHGVVFEFFVATGQRNGAPRPLRSR